MGVRFLSSLMQRTIESFFGTSATQHTSQSPSKYIVRDKSQRKRTPLKRRSSNKPKVPQIPSKRKSPIEQGAPFKKLKASPKGDKKIAENINITHEPIVEPKPSEQLPTLHFDKLPTKVLIRIFSKLSLKDLNIATQVCKHWQTIGNNNGFWRPPFETRYPSFWWVKRIKLRPMGVCKQIFNSAPLAWDSVIPDHGAYLWHLSFEQLSSSQDKLQELMGTGRLYLQIGFERKSITSSSSLAKTSISGSKIYHQINGTEREALLLINRIIGKFTIFLPTKSENDYKSMEWKNIPSKCGGLVPFCGTNSAGIRVAVQDLCGHQSSFSISLDPK